MARSSCEALPVKQRLTESESHMLWFIAKSIDRDGYQPSMREIASELGFSSPGYVPRMVDSCISKGAVRGKRGARAIIFDWRSYL